MNPVTDGVKYGIFIVPSNLLSTCFYEYQIGNYLDNAGYYSTYYDVENAATDLFTFSFTVPSNAITSSPIYFTVDSYPLHTVPYSCVIGNVSSVRMMIYSQVGTSFNLVGSAQYPYEATLEPIQPVMV